MNYLLNTISTPLRFAIYFLSALSSLILYGWIWSLLFGLLDGDNELPTPWHALFLIIYHSYNSEKTNILLCLTLLIPFVFVLFLIGSTLQKKRLSKLFGDAHWASWSEIKKMELFCKSGLIIGIKNGRLLQAKLVSHALVFAPSRSGKGVSQVIPNALSFKGSLLVIDLKQEIFDNTSGFRKAHGQDVFLFAPANIEGKTHRWNPLDLVSHHSTRCISDLQLIVNVLIPKNNGAESMWIDEARAIAVGLLLWLKDSGRPFTLGELAALVKGTPDFAGFLKDIIEQSIVGEELAKINPIAFMNINNFIQKAVKEQSGVKSTLTARLNLWDDPLINAATATSDFDVREMRRKRMSVYLGIPTNQLTRLAPLMNLFVQLFLNAMTEHLPSTDEPFKVLAILDEFCALGRMESLKNGFGFLAGYNIHLMAIIQNVGQFYDLYGGRDNSDVFFQNTDYKIVYRQNTRTDQEFISNQLGTCTVENHSKSFQSGAFFAASPSTNKSLIQRPLLTPNEVRTFPKEEGIAIINGEPPVRYTRIIHYQDKRFKDRVLPPIHIEPIKPHYSSLPIQKKDEKSASSQSVAKKDLITAKLQEVMPSVLAEMHHITLQKVEQEMQFKKFEKSLDIDEDLEID